MNMNLKLEIEEGHKYDNLLQEIELEYKTNIEKADLFLKNKNYEKSLILFYKNISLDPDNHNHKKTLYTFTRLLNKLLNKYIEFTFQSYLSYEYHNTLYYVCKSISLIKYFKDYINMNSIDIKQLNYIFKNLNKFKIDFNHTKLYDFTLII